MLTKPKLPVAEELLIDYARRLERHREGRRCLWIHLSRLARHNRNERDIQLAANLLRPLVRRFHGEVFALAGGDVVVCLKDAEGSAIESALFDLRFSFARDPLMKRVDDEGSAAYLTSFDLAKDYKRFHAQVQAACSTAEPVPEEPASREQPISARLILSRAELEARSPAASLPGHIDTSQGRIAIERLLERQTIGRLEEGPVARAWGLRESVRMQALDAFEVLATAVSRQLMAKSAALAEIERLLLPGWSSLLRTEGTERHLLLFRTETLISAEFLVFDRWIEAKRLERPRIGFFVEDALEDKESTHYLRGFLRERGYRVGLCGVALAGLAQAKEALAGMSFLEVAVAGDVAAADAARLARLVGDWGPDTVLATGVTSAQSLGSLYEAGLRLVSGPALRV